jgi:hypothetical protein
MPSPISVANSSAQLTGKTLVTLEDEQNITSLKRFNRSPSAPFEVQSGSAAVANLDADKLDGQQGSDYHDAGQLTAGTIPAARFPAALPAIDGAALVNLNAAHLTGVIPDSAVPAVLPAVSGAALTSLPAGNLTGALAAISGAALTALPNPLPAVSGANLTGIIPKGINFAKSDAGSANVGTSETDLTGFAFTIAANRLAVVGDGYLLEGHGAVAANGATKTLRLDIAGQKLIVMQTTGSGYYYYFRLRLTYYSASVVRISGTVMTATASGVVVATTVSQVVTSLSSLNFANSQTLKMTGQGTTGSGDITLLEMTSAWALN